MGVEQNVLSVQTARFRDTLPQRQNVRRHLRGNTRIHTHIIILTYTNAHPRARAHTQLRTRARASTHTHTYTHVHTRQVLTRSEDIEFEGAKNFGKDYVRTEVFFF